MPKVHFSDTTIECPEGANLRMVLLRARQPLYNSVSRALNCRGNGTCGTCAVRIDGIEGSVNEATKMERLRLRVPPHTPDSGLRLACQVSVQGDIQVTKQPGIWGQHEE